MRIRYYKNQKGIGLIEVIAALGLSVVVLTSLVALSLFTVRSSLQSKLMLEGTKIAEREMELVRAYRDSADAWKAPETGDIPGIPKYFIDEMVDCSSRCHMDYNNLIVVDGPDTVGSQGQTLTRYFFATDIDGGALEDTDQAVRVTVVVEWKVGPQTKYARLYTDLTNWENK